MTSTKFGRCPNFVLVDSETLEFKSFSNPAVQMSGGAGPAAVQELARHGAEIAVAGQIGPKAESALAAAGIQFVAASGTVRDAVRQCAEDGAAA